MPVDPDAQALQRENEQLKAQLANVESGRVQAVTLLNDITKRLAEMTGKEAEIRARQSELDAATWETETDLRKQITTDLEALQTEMEETRKKYEEALQAAESSPEIGRLKETITNLRRLVDEKDRTISDLRDRMRVLEEEADTLRQEVEQGREEMAELLDNQQRTDEERRQQRDLIEELNEIGAGYIFVGHPDEIEAAFRRRDILRHGRTYHASQDVVMAPVPPRIFRKIDPKDSEISLGYHLRDVDILSVHKRYEQTFYVGRNGDETVLRLQNPAAFWTINKYLIVRVRE